MQVQPTVVLSKKTINNRYNAHTLTVYIHVLITPDRVLRPSDKLHSSILQISVSQAFAAVLLHSANTPLSFESSSCV